VDLSVLVAIANCGALAWHASVFRRECSTAAERRNLLKKDLEPLVVEAKKLGLELDDVIDALAEHWKRLDDTMAIAGRRS